jgi:hypothetical protein
MAGSELGLGRDCVARSTGSSGDLVVGYASFRNIQSGLGPAPPRPAWGLPHPGLTHYQKDTSQNPRKSLKTHTYSVAPRQALSS